MNTGIADGFDVATRLAAVISGQAAPAVLDGYELHRRAAALEVLRFTDSMTRMSMLRHPMPRAARRLGASTVGRLRPVQRRVAMWVTSLQRSPLRGDLPCVDRSEPELTSCRS